MAATVYIGLGSNIENRFDYLKKGLQAMNADERIRVVDVSSIYETDPVGYVHQDAFLNMVAEIQTGYSPFDLLDFLLDVEQRHGRTRNLKWGPRTLDLDILLYDQENIKSKRLEVPHPRMKDRGFVLIPLYELNPYLFISPLNQSLEDMVAQLADKQGVRLWKKRSGQGAFGLFE